MRRILALCLALSTAVAVTACNESSSADPECEDGDYVYDCEGMKAICHDGRWVWPEEEGYEELEGAQPSADPVRAIAQSLHHLLDARARTS